MAVVFALLAAVGYGAADFLGARAARTNTAPAVTFVAQLVSLVLILPVAVVIGGPFGDQSDVVLGLGAGIAAATALSLFYWGMSRGAIALVAPVTAITGIVVPVVWGLGFGESPGPAVVIGLVAAPFAVGIVCAGDGLASFAGMRSVVIAGIVGGALFGSIYIMLGEMSPDIGWWPLVYLRLASVPLAFVLARGGAISTARGSGAFALCLWCGFADAVANVGLLVASRNGYVSVVAVVASMYPAITLFLASRIDHEKIGSVRKMGLALAGLVVVLVAVG